MYYSYAYLSLWCGDVVIILGVIMEQAQKSNAALMNK